MNLRKDHYRSLGGGGLPPSITEAPKLSSPGAETLSSEELFLGGGETNPLSPDNRIELARKEEFASIIDSPLRRRG